MAILKIRQGDWVVVCDGAKALILENAGDGMHPNLKTKEVHAQHRRQDARAGHRRARALDQFGRRAAQRDGADRLARRRPSSVSSPSSAKRLDAAVTAGETKSVIMVAPPRALGVLRQAYSNGLRGAVRAEIDKDYVRMPVHEIEKRLAA